jgi:myo-inositol 2-dehydrogenase/D-chiro-inositol 1-dehydrogenase
MHAQTIVRIAGLELAAIVARSDASATDAKHDHPLATIHRSLDTLLADPRIDLVDIVSPNARHAEMAIAALGAGKHVLLEKPLATTLEDGERVAAAAERSGLYLGVGLELRASKQWKRIRELIDDGAIGRPTYANFTLFRRPFRPGANNWRRTTSEVGSWILEEPIHYFDLLLWYFHASGLPTRVTAHGVPSPLGARMFDTMTATLSFGDGAFATFSQCVAGFEHSLVLELIGTEGALRTWWAAAMDRSRTPRFELKLRARGDSEPHVVPIEASGEVFELEEELRGLITGVPTRRPLVSAREALAALRLCLDAERAIASGSDPGV